MGAKFSFLKSPNDIRLCAHVLLRSTNKDALYDAAEYAVKAYPRSRKLIEYAVFGRDRMKRAEAHQVLFFHFGNASLWTARPRNTKRYGIMLAERYLVALKVDRCSVAFTAAELLAEDRPLYLSRPALTRVIRKARYLEGRSAALRHMRDLWMRLKKEKSKRAKAELRKLRDYVEDLAVHGRDFEERADARSVLRDSGAMTFEEWLARVEK